MISGNFSKTTTRLRSPDRNRKMGLGDALREPSRHIKSFDLAEALTYSYVRDISYNPYIYFWDWRSIRS